METPLISLLLRLMASNQSDQSSLRSSLITSRIARKSPCGSFSFAQWPEAGQHQTFDALDHLGYVRRPLRRVLMVLAGFRGRLAPSWPSWTPWPSLGAPLAWKQTRSCHMAHKRPYENSNKRKRHGLTGRPRSLARRKARRTKEPFGVLRGTLKGF